MAFIFTTTGLQDPVIFNDIGGRTFDHPTTSYDLEDEFAPEEIAESADIQAAIDNGWITVVDENDNPITEVEDTSSAIPMVSLSEAQAGVLSERRIWSPERVRQAVEALVPAATSDQISVYDGSGGTSIGDSWADLPLDGTSRKSGFSHTPPSAEVTVATDAIYVIIGCVSVDQVSGSSRSESVARLMLDEGGGYAEVEGTRIGNYSRTSSQGKDTGCFAIILTLSAGDKLKLQAMRSSGSGSLATLADGVSLSIFSTGRGPQGPTGPAGSGSTIRVLDDGLAVTATPHEMLNFIGFTLSNAGGGIVDIEAPSGGGGTTINPPSSSEGESSTSSTYWQQKLEHNFTSDGGYYEIDWYCEIKDSEDEANVHARVQINNSDTIAEVDPTEEDNHRWKSFSGKYVSQFPAGNVEVDLDYRSDDWGETVNIRRARIYSRKVVVAS